MATTPSVPNALDGRKLDALKATASQDPAKAAKDAARQFETVFTNMLLKSLREAMPRTGLMGESTGIKTFEGMQDQQLAESLSSGKGLGLAPVIERQLLKLSASRTGDKAVAIAGSQPIALNRNPGAIAWSKAAAPVPLAPKTDPALKFTPVTTTATAPAQAPVEKTPEGFIDKLKDYAGHAAQLLGVPRAFLLGQAALETAWGKREIGTDQGVKSHNVFGIKAGPGWKGETVEVPTTEYENGVAKKVTAKFRAYSSYQEAFNDYAKLVKDSPRYSAAASAGADPHAFAHGLQRGGYATDPKYGEKLAQVIASASKRGA